MASSLLPFSLPEPNLIKASCSLPPTATSTISTPETLDQKFGRKGIKFSESGNVPLVELTVRNGSSLRLRIPDGLVTSYKPKVNWKDDGFEEVLYTCPAAVSDSSANPKGGIGLVINDVSDPASKLSPLPTQWTVKDVDSDAIDALQVELSCTSGNLDITYAVSLYPESMATAVLVNNNGRKPVSLTSAMLSHFKFKRRGGAAIQGLKGCSYCSHPPLSSPFEILSPAEAMITESPGWFSFDSKSEKKPGSWTVQDDPYIMLKNKMSRIYTAPPTERLKAFYDTPPSKYETIDQGCELFFRVIRIGYEDIYLSTPGSLSEKYGKEYFICTGPASMLVPVVVNPGEGWRAAQVIEHDNFNKRELPVAAVASVPYIPASVDYLETEFGGHGVAFEGLGDSYVVKMGLENGSLASLMLPSGLITSYKAPIWHGGTLELLHTTVTEEQSGALVQGGVSLALDCESDGGISWSPNSWVLQDVRGNAEELIQVEMISSDPESIAEVKYIVTLQPDLLSSKIVISNSKSLPLQMTGSVISHLTVSNPDATYAIGLEGSNFFSRAPFFSNFCLIPPGFGQKNEVDSSQLWGLPGIKRFLSGWNAKNHNDADQLERMKGEDMEGEEEDNYKKLSSEMSRIYTSAPRNFRVIDRGRRNSVVVRRDGFKELYMFSPGCNHEYYSKYTYICVGQSAVLEPIILGPEDVWKGVTTSCDTCTLGSARTSSVDETDSEPAWICSPPQPPPQYKFPSSATS